MIKIPGLTLLWSITAVFLSLFILSFFVRIIYWTEEEKMKNVCEKHYAGFQNDLEAWMFMWVGKVTQKHLKNKKQRSNFNIWSPVDQLNYFLKCVLRRTFFFFYGFYKLVTSRKLSLNLFIITCLDFYSSIPVRRNKAYSVIQRVIQKY